MREADSFSISKACCSDVTILFSATVSRSTSESPDEDWIFTKESPSEILVAVSTRTSILETSRLMKKRINKTPKITDIRINPSNDCTFFERVACTSPSDVAIIIYSRSGS